MWCWRALRRIPFAAVWCEETMTSYSVRSKLSTAPGYKGRNHRWRRAAPGIRASPEERTRGASDAGPCSCEYRIAKIGASGNVCAITSTQRSAPPRWTSGSDTMATRGLRDRGIDHADGLRGDVRGVEAADPRARRDAGGAQPLRVAQIGDDRGSERL